MPLTKQTLEQLRMLKDLTEDDMEVISEEFGSVLVETQLWKKYKTLNKSYEKYQDDQGWANALFHYFDYERDDWENWEEWINMVYEKEKALYVQNHPNDNIEL